MTLPASLVRLAAIEDASPIASVLRRAFVEFEPLYTPEAFAITTPSAEQIRARWSEGPVWAAYQGDQMVGTVAAVPEDKGVYVRSMAVDPGRRGQGAGRLLLDHVEHFALTLGVGRLYLSTTPFLHGAIR